MKRTGQKHSTQCLDMNSMPFFFFFGVNEIYEPWNLFQVRVYTPKRVFQELEGAKEEYIRAAFGIRKDQKILLPKIVEAYAKDSGLCAAGIMEMIQQSLPESLRKSVRKCQLSKSRKSIEWIPHNFTFRYLISKELVRWFGECLVLELTPRY